MNANDTNHVASVFSKSRENIISMTSDPNVLQLLYALHTSLVISMANEIAEMHPQFHHEKREAFLTKCGLPE
jgi:hypothetical protein